MIDLISVCRIFSTRACTAASILLTGIIVSTLYMCGAPAEAATNDLMLIPYPKEAKRSDGVFHLSRRLKVSVNSDLAANRLAKDLVADIFTAAKDHMDLQTAPRSEGAAWELTISADGEKTSSFGATGDIPDHPESYVLTVAEDGVAIKSKDEAGLLWGIQTLRQLVRSNSMDGRIPCLTVADYPSLKWRGFQDDLTRGQSSTVDFMKSEIDMGSYLKMNFWTYYMEHQYQFLKHPDIGTEGGCLTPKDLRRLVGYARGSGIEIIGCQQSFGHFHNILKHDKYRNLAETTWVVCPTNEDTYKLLDDMYSEVAPLLDSQLFNVCCDETVGLGEGPSKPLAEKIGVGGVYAQHLQRLHQILRDNHGKRMMMWGDIILNHPENLKDIPKDTLVLSWGYHPAESFEYAVTPFAKAGYEFWIAPGVNCWNMILPNFDASVVNIKNFVRDGLKHGTTGMLNTTWDDDGENLYSVNWHGIAWGSECAWNGSATDIEDFNRRLGAVLFGEEDGNFGKAIQLLGKLHTLPGYDMMMNRRFWNAAFAPSPVEPSWKPDQAKALLAVVDPALEHLKKARLRARFNSEVIDHHLFVAERARLMASRELDFVKACQAYHTAEELESKDAAPHVRRAIEVTTGIRDKHVELRDRYTELWLAENRPYALDWSVAKYNRLIGEYEGILQRLNLALQAAESRGNLPTRKETGLTVDLETIGSLP